MQEYHLVQKGPVFERDLEVTLSRTGQYQVITKSHKDGKVDRDSGALTLPPDVYNGMVITIAKNIAPGDTQTRCISWPSRRSRVSSASNSHRSARRA